MGAKGVKMMRPVLIFLSTVFTASARLAPRPVRQVFTWQKHAGVINQCVCAVCVWAGGVLGKPH